MANKQGAPEKNASISKTAKSASTEPAHKRKFVVVRVRGEMRIRSDFADTLTMLGLHRKNYCTIVDGSQLGMIKKVKDFVTYGEIDAVTEKMLIEKRAEKTIGKDGKEKTKRFFRLQPPRKGFGRRGIKTSFTRSGALGYRADKINDLVQRML